MLTRSNALAVAMISDPGRVRRHNEDACAADVECGAFVVCDGVGGAAGGEIASRIAADAMLEWLVATRDSGAVVGERLDQGVALANARIVQGMRQNRALRGMGTTLVALLAERVEEPGRGCGCWGKVWLANVGDSRCYRWRGGMLEQLTRDHSLVEEQVRAGAITREQAELSPMRNVITRAVGSYAAVQADIEALAAEYGDLYLLATDGLMRELADEEIAGMLGEAQLPMDSEILNRICTALVEAANARGGADNITCALVHLH
jgi:PPM family protein phosphatase